MDDLISRQDALKAICFLEAKNDKANVFSDDFDNISRTKSMIAINNLPSAQPEPQWIPVTKDTLPEEGKVVIVKGEKGTWDVGTYRGYGHIVGLEDIHRWIWKKNTSKKVYWWMYKDGALPEPYKEVQ